MPPETRYARSGGPLCALFAATYPARTTALIMIASYARLRPALYAVERG